MGYKTPQYIYVALFLIQNNGTVLSGDLARWATDKKSDAPTILNLRARLSDLRAYGYHITSTPIPRSRQSRYRLHKIPVEHLHYYTNYNTQDYI
jgi:hypothetical protein